MFYIREWSISGMFYTWDLMQKEISVTSKMFYFMVPHVLRHIHFSIKMIFLRQKKFPSREMERWPQRVLDGSKQDFTKIYFNFVDLKSSSPRKKSLWSRKGGALHYFTTVLYNSTRRTTKMDHRVTRHEGTLKAKKFKILRNGLVKHKKRNWFRNSIYSNLLWT